jgi:hypothetical protein
MVFAYFTAGTQLMAEIRPGSQNLVQATFHKSRDPVAVKMDLPVHGDMKIGSLREGPKIPH